MSLRLAQANLYPQQQKTEMAFTCSSLLGVRLPISIRHSTNDMKTLEGPSLSWPTPHTTPFFLPPEDPYPILLRRNSEWRTCAAVVCDIYGSGERRLMWTSLTIMH